MVKKKGDLHIGVLNRYPLGAEELFLFLNKFVMVVRLDASVSHGGVMR